jgi:hypothetical protein
MQTLRYRFRYAVAGNYVAFPVPRQRRADCPRRNKLNFPCQKVAQEQSGRAKARPVKYS